MPVLSGNVSGSISTVPFNIPCKIISGYFVNKTGGDVILNVYVATGSGDRSIVPLNLTLISGTMYIIDETVLLPANYYLIIVTNGSLDYYITIQ